MRNNVNVLYNELQYENRAVFNHLSRVFIKNELKKAAVKPNKVTVLQVSLNRINLFD